MDETFGLRWPGKAQALARAGEPPASRAARTGPEGASALWRGDNLEAMKHLVAQGFAGRFRAAYLDPPYNTGAMQRYDDDFRLPAAEAPDPADRKHRAWLSMMAPRLVLVRELLAREGAVFVSIDDHESPYLRCLLDEVFGPANFVSTIVWRKKVVRGRGARHVLPQTEYVHVYARSLKDLAPFSEPLTEAMRGLYRHADPERGPYKLLPLAKSGTAHSARPNLRYDLQAPDGTLIPCPTHQWRWSAGTVAERADELFFRRRKGGGWSVYTKQFLNPDGEAERRQTPRSYYDRATTTDAARELKERFGRPVLDFPKPLALLRDLLSWVSPPGSGREDWILDPFAGSATTAEAVLDLNAADGGARRCVSIQRPEPLPGDPEFETLADLARARIERRLALGSPEPYAWVTLA